MINVKAETDSRKRCFYLSIGLQLSSIFNKCFPIQTTWWILFEKVLDETHRFICAKTFITWTYGMPICDLYRNKRFRCACVSRWLVLPCSLTAAACTNAVISRSRGRLIPFLNERWFYLWDPDLSKLELFSFPTYLIGGFDSIVLIAFHRCYRELMKCDDGWNKRRVGYVYWSLFLQSH